MALDKHLTTIPGLPDPAAVIDGMAFFAGTGPDGKTCGDCKHRGYYRESTRGKWDETLRQVVFNSYRVAKCAMYKRLSGGGAWGGHCDGLPSLQVFRAV